MAHRFHRKAVSVRAVKEHRAVQSKIDKIDQLSSSEIARIKKKGRFNLVAERQSLVAKLKPMPPELVPFTPEEEEQRDLEEAAEIARLAILNTRKGAANRRVKLEEKTASEKFNNYKDSSIMLSQTQLDAYKQQLINASNTAKLEIEAINTGSPEGDIEAIRNYVTTWPLP